MTTLLALLALIFLAATMALVLVGLRMRQRLITAETVICVYYTRLGGWTENGDRAAQQYSDRYGLRLTPRR